MILAGDVGGTNTRLAFFGVSGGELTKAESSAFPSRRHASLDEIVAKFIDRTKMKADQACFGLAGPIEKGRCKPPNLDWVVDASKLARQLGTDQVWLVNDLEANAWGIAALKAEDFAPLNEGAIEAEGNAAVISAGTGLGEAGMIWDGSRNHTPFATEGGHADFAPRSELEIELLMRLMEEFGRVSVERVVSGPGLHNIYRFLRDSGRGEEPKWLAESMRKGDPPSEISKAALAASSPLCVQALSVFISIYGAEAGNLALKVKATGGVYVGGGIAPKIAGKMKEGQTFMKAFTGKGRMRPLLEATPVLVILNEDTALLGAARCAAVRASLM